MIKQIVQKSKKKILFFDIDPKNISNNNLEEEESNTNITNEINI